MPLPTNNSERLAALIQWVADLRSGNYHQGKANLCKLNPSTQRWEMCCLGVLADRQDLFNGQAETLVPRTPTWCSTDCKTIDELGAILPRDVAEAFGLNEKAADWKVLGDAHLSCAQYAMDTPRVHDLLMDFNDEADWTFAQIADYIEETRVKPLKEKLNAQ